MKLFIFIIFQFTILPGITFSQIKDPDKKKDQVNIQKKQVMVGILVVDINKIDDAKLSITLDFAKKEREKFAHKMDSWSKFIFPLLYVIIITITFYI